MDELRERLQAVISAGDDLRYDEYGVSEFPLGHLARKWDDAKAAMEAFMAQPVPATSDPAAASFLERLKYYVEFGLHGSADDPIYQAVLKIHNAGFELAHESAKCGHARANYRDPNYKKGDTECDCSKCEFCEALAAQPVPAEGAQARLRELQSEFAILSRACGNWREWPEGTVSKNVPDYAHDDWKAAARAILERDELRAAAPPVTAAPAEPVSWKGVKWRDSIKATDLAAEIALHFAHDCEDSMCGEDADESNCETAWIESKLSDFLDQQAAAPPSTPAERVFCEAIKDSFVCNLRRGHAGDHMDLDGSSGCVGWSASTPASREPK
jgi:hypothetical protein